jgi:periplasmic divalent cation tolerance protein
MTNLLLVCCTMPDAAVARQIGTVLIQKQLAACVNILPRVESIYRWKDIIETSFEVQCIIKTTNEMLTELERILVELHPYEVPEIIALRPHAVSSAYGQWVIGSVSAAD